MHWNGRPLILSTAAYRELEDSGLSLDDVVKVLQDGYEFPCKRRKEGIVEKCLGCGRDVLKVVVAESFHYASRELVWLVIHVKKVRR